MKKEKISLEEAKDIFVSFSITQLNNIKGGNGGSSSGGDGNDDDENEI